MTLPRAFPHRASVRHTPTTRRYATVWICAFAIQFSLGCFDPPAAAVLFQCVPANANSCPAGYTCEEDRCCHRNGSRIEDHHGECALGGETSDASDASDASDG